MATFISNYLGLRTMKPDSIRKSTTRALPSSWYRSDELYQLERRAIFSKRWILVTHQLRFPAAGDFVRFEEAGFQFFLCRNREGTINGFHNVCRHRAFPLITEGQGRARILSCKYHGWSYSLNGKLAKAPGYDEMNGFDEAQNGLFPVHINVDAKGFVWVNMDSADEPTVPWGEDFDGVDSQSRMDGFDFEEYRFDHIWEMSGDYNWKTLADNYNECYHCATAHPDAAAIADLSLYSVDTQGGHIQHFANTDKTQDKEGMRICSTFYYPNACMTVSPNFFYMMRCVPTSAHHCSMEYEVYRHRSATDEGFERIDSMFKRILGEDKWLCNHAQKNLDRGVFVSGELHARMEKEPLFFQQKVREMVRAHRREQEKLKREIWPARQVLPKGSTSNEEDELFCAGLACDDMENGKLDW